METFQVHGHQERNVVLKQKAQEIEADFLSEMLSFAGLEGASGPFGGGIGEDQFSSFLRKEQAKNLVDRGGIGLAERLYQALLLREGGQK